MPDPNELSRLGQAAAEASNRARQNGIGPDTNRDVTQAENDIFQYLHSAAEQKRSQGLSEDQIRAQLAAEIENARRKT